MSLSSAAPGSKSRARFADGGAGGLDALVFTGGIGEHAAQVRQRVCEGAAWLGLSFDAAANAAHGPCITRAGSAVSAWVVATDEDEMIMRHSRRMLRPETSIDAAG
jgi:acetate kinase